MLVKLLNAFGKGKMFGINLFEFFDQFWKRQNPMQRTDGYKEK